MADESCASCGEVAKDPVWAIYADESFQNRRDPQRSFALHERCFTASEWIDAAHWENDENDQPYLVTERKLRYLRVASEGKFMLVGDTTVDVNG